MISKYQPIVDYLAVQTEQAVTLTFEEIEAILGGPLTEALRRDATMWSGAHYAYVRAWEKAGWSAALDRQNGCVHFIRDAQPG